MITPTGARGADTKTHDPLEYPDMEASKEQRATAEAVVSRKTKTKKAAVKINKAARKRRKEKDEAAKVLAAVMQRRRTRKRDLAARLLQWTWKRRHQLKPTCPPN